MASLKITSRLYNAVMNAMETVLFSKYKGYTNIFDLEWDYLIILDACRYDVFSKIYDMFFTDNDAELRKVTSRGTSTMDFIRKYFSDKTTLERIKDLIFINSNPLIDKTLYNMGINPEKAFYKYYPLWKNFWNFKLGSVNPEAVYRTTLKVFVKYSNKEMIIWFLQPHYPYISEESSLSKIGRDFMNKSLTEDSDNNFLLLFRILKKMMIRGQLSAGIPEGLSELMRERLTEVKKAYLYNLALVFKYVKELTKILPGTAVVTSDHGEAFGEYLSRLLPIRVYGHPSRIRIPSLIEVPYLRIRNNISREEAIRRAYCRILKSKVMA